MLILKLIFHLITFLYPRPNTYQDFIGMILFGKKSCDYYYHYILNTKELFYLVMFSFK